jgi:hypothetical protein
LLSEKLAHQPQRRSGVAAALNQHVENLAFVIDGTPEIHPLAGDPNNHLVQMPSIARARTAPPQPPRDHRSELQHPAPDGFVGDVEPTLGEQILNVSVAEREAQVEPDRMLDDNRRKPVTTV